MIAVNWQESRDVFQLEMELRELLEREALIRSRSKCLFNQDKKIGLAEKYQVGIIEKRKRRFSLFLLESYDTLRADTKINPKIKHFGNGCDTIFWRTRGDGLSLDPRKK